MNIRIERQKKDQEREQEILYLLHFKERENLLIESNPSG